jgi:ketosteroid isomerase-like protein
MKAVILVALVLAGCASAPRVDVPDAAPVVAAERAFAARAGEVGWVPAFREFVAPDGQLLQPNGYANAPAELAATEDDGNRNLFWWPAFAGISRAGDFGFTTGAVSFDEARTPRGHYFTVWRRQSDGSWKWIYDGGVGPITNAAALTTPGGEVSMLATADAGEASAEAAVAAVTALEAAGDIRLAPEVRRVHSREALIVGASAGASQDEGFDLVRVEASAGGDLVLVLGTRRWAGRMPVRAYARMWQRRHDGWVVVYEQRITP